MTNSENLDGHSLTIVEDIFIAIHCSEQNPPHVLDAVVEVNLAEFELSPSELEKLTRILHRVNCNIMNVLSQVSPAVSLNAKVCRKDMKG